MDKILKRLKFKCDLFKKNLIKAIKNCSQKNFADYFNFFSDFDNFSSHKDFQTSFATPRKILIASKSTLISGCC